LLLQRFHKLERENEVEDDIYLLRAEQRYLLWLNYLHRIASSSSAQPILPPIGKKEWQFIMRSGRGDAFLIM
jgi:hypothetical protein